MINLKAIEIYLINYEGLERRGRPALEYIIIMASSHLN